MDIAAHGGLHSTEVVGSQQRGGGVIAGVGWGHGRGGGVTAEVVESQQRVAAQQRGGEVTAEVVGSQTWTLATCLFSKGGVLAMHLVKGLWVLGAPPLHQLLWVVQPLSPGSILGVNVLG